MGGGLAFKVFGLSWNSIVFTAATFSSLTFLLHVYLLRKIGFGKVLSIMTALYVQSITVVIRGYWYYNFITIITAILFISSAILYLKDQNNIKNRIILILVTSFLFLVKVNIAAPLLILTYLFLLFSTTNRKHIVIIILLSSFLSLLLLFSFSIHPLDIVENYMISSSRVLSFDGWISFIFLNQRWEVEESFLFFLPILIAFFVSTIDSIFITRHIQKNKFFLILPFISIIIGIIALGTNNDFNMTDGSLVVFGIILFIFFWQKQSKDMFLKKLIYGLSFITIAAFTISGFYKGYDRFGLREGLAPNQRGVEFFFDGSSERPPLTNISDSFFFNTLKAGPLFNNTTKNIGIIINKAKDTKANLRESVFIGPRIDFSYAANNLFPAKGLPLWWEPFSNGSLPLSKIMINRFIDKKIKLAIFLFQNYPFIPSELTLYLNSEYDTYEYRGLTVYILKNEQSLNPLRKILKEG